MIFSYKNINHFFYNQRNPLTVRQEIQTFDDIIPETTLADVQLNEMPGLQNTGRHFSEI
jgi:hypothetical protein